MSAPEGSAGDVGKISEQAVDCQLVDEPADHFLQGIESWCELVRAERVGMHRQTGPVCSRDKACGHRAAIDFRHFDQLTDPRPDTIYGARDILQAGWRL